MRGRCFVAILGAFGAILAGEGRNAPARIALADSPALNLAVRTLEDRLYRETPTTPAAIEEVEWRARQVERAVERADLDAVNRREILDAVAEFRRRAGGSLVRWDAGATLADLRARWETTCRPRFLPAGGARAPTAALDAIQRQRRPDEDNDLLARLEFLDRQYADLLELAARFADPHPDDGAFRDEASRWSRRIRDELWRPPLPLTEQAPRDLRRAWRLLAETRSVIQALLSTPWRKTFVEAARREIPVERKRIQDTRDHLLRTY